MISNSNKKVIKGALDLLTSVGSTIGPSGRCVIIKSNDTCFITKDGATVANEFFTEDPEEMAGAEIARETAMSTANLAGDGTTTSSVIAKSLIERGLKSSANPILLKEGMLKAYDFVVEKIREQAIHVKGDYSVIKAVASISANNDEAIGKIVADAVISAGEHGVVKYELHDKKETIVEHLHGFNIEDRGYTHPGFVNADDTCVLNNVRILITNKKISNQSELVGICEAVNRSKEALLIIAEEVNSEALAFLLKNVNKTLKCCVIQAPGYGFVRDAICNDLAIATNSTYLNETKSILDASISDLGFAKEVLINRDSTIIAGVEKSNELDVRIDSIKSLISKNKDEIESRTLKSRLANLTSGTSVIKIGGSNPVEQKELQARIDDSLRAVYSAINEGVILGGGITLLKISQLIDLQNFDEHHRDGVRIVKESLSAPFIEILSNSGITDYSEILDKVSINGEFGFNAKTKCIENFIDSKILDPAKVARIALENSISTANNLLTTNYVIVK